jgi:hypothetical protein
VVCQDLTALAGSESADCEMSDRCLRSEFGHRGLAPDASLSSSYFNKMRCTNAIKSKQQAKRTIKESNDDESLPGNGDGGGVTMLQRNLDDEVNY